MYADFRRVGEGLGIPALPRGYAAWEADRAAHMARDLAAGAHTAALYAAYARALGPWRSASAPPPAGCWCPRRTSRP